MSFQFGVPGWLPLAGDWNNTGSWSVGVFDPSSATFYLRNTTLLTDKGVNVFQYGAQGWLPVAGRWDGLTFGVGVVDPTTETWYIRNATSPGEPSVPRFAYGGPGWTPLAGSWNGSSKLAHTLAAEGSTDLAARLIALQKKQPESDPGSELDTNPTSGRSEDSSSAPTER
jgi:hypothetical protein